MGDENIEDDQTPTGRFKALLQFAVDEVKGEIKSSEERISQKIDKAADVVRNDRRSLLNSLKNALKFFFSDVDKH